MPPKRNVSTSELTLEDIAKQIDVSNKRLDNKLDKVLSDLEAINNRLSKLETIQNEHSSSLNFYGEEIEDIKNNISAIKAGTASIDSVSVLEHQLLQKQLSITGVPFKSNENLLEALEKMAKKINNDLTARTDIDSVFRVKQSDKVIVKFVNTHVRNSFFVSYKASPMTTKDLGFRESNKIFVNEILNKAQADLFYHARKAKKRLDYKYCWTAGQKVYLRKSNDTEAVIIASKNDLSALT